MFYSLNALRGVFISLIFFHHCYNIAGINQFHFGRIGVMFFFMLSGFVLMHSHRAQIAIEGDINWLNFSIKRASKIFPLHWLMACAAILVAVALGQVDVEFWKSLPFNLTLTQSWIPLNRFVHSLNTLS